MNQVVLDPFAMQLLTVAIHKEVGTQSPVRPRTEVVEGCLQVITVQGGNKGPAQWRDATVAGDLKTLAGSCSSFSSSLPPHNPWYLPHFQGMGEMVLILTQGPCQSNPIIFCLDGHASDGDLSGADSSGKKDSHFRQLSQHAA